MVEEELVVCLDGEAGEDGLPGTGTTVAVMIVVAVAGPWVGGLLVVAAGFVAPGLFAGGALFAAVVVAAGGMFVVGGSFAGGGLFTVGWLFAVGWFAGG